MNLLIRWAISAVALWVTVELGAGLSMAEPGIGTLLWVALLIGLVNAVVRPIMILLTLPLTVLTLGLFLLVVNGLSIAIVAALTPLETAGFGGAVLGALVLSVISAVLAALLGDERRLRG